MDNDVFRTKKFVTDEEELWEVTEMMVARQPDFVAGLDEKEQHAYKVQYKGFFSHLLNSKRTDVGNGCKASVDVWRKFYSKNKRANVFNNFPPIDDVLRCAKRDLNLEIPVGADKDNTGDIIKYSPDGPLLHWYWCHMIPKAMGKHLFGPNVRHFETISDAKWFKDGE